jgi:hypothetical protein
VSIIEPPYGDDFDLSTQGGMAYARGAIIQAGVREGYGIGSVTQALQGYGVSFTGSQVSQTFHAYEEILAQGQTAAQLSVDADTGEILGGNPPDNWTGQYVHQVTATFRARTSSGAYELRTRTLGIKSSELLSPEDAVNAAQSVIETPVGEDDEDTYGGIGDLLLSHLTGVWYGTSRGILSGRDI